MALGENLKKKQQPKSSANGTTAKKPERKDLESMSPSQSSKKESVKSGKKSSSKAVEKEQEIVGQEVESEDLQEVTDLKAGQIQIVVFPVEEEEYAFDINMVKEVIGVPPIAPLPHVEKNILGVANVRGNVMAIIDLGQKLGFRDEAKPEQNTYIMVIKDDVFQIALSVSKVPETMVLNRSEISKPDGVMMKNAGDQKYLTGIIRKEKRMIMLLDVQEMFGMTK